VTETKPAQDTSTLVSYAALAGVHLAAFGWGLNALVKSGHRLPERVEPRDLIVQGVATYQVSRVLSRGKITRFARAPVTAVQPDQPTPPGELAEAAKAPEGPKRAMGELMTCTLCLDQWVAAGFALAHARAPQPTRVVAWAFAVKSVADVLHLAYTRTATVEPD
jgi:hypothetical protein